LSAKEIIKIISKIGFQHVRTKGSHYILNKKTEKGKITIPVPLYKELAKGTLKAIIEQSGLTREEFIELL